MVGQWAIPDVQFVGMESKQFDNKKVAGAKKQAFIASVQFMGGKLEFFVSEQDLVKSPFHGVASMAKGNLSGHIELRASANGFGMQPVLVPTKFVVAKPADRAAFALPGLVGLIAVVALLFVFIASASADPFVVRGTNTVADGAAVDVVHYGGGEFGGSRYLGEGDQFGVTVESFPGGVFNFYVYDYALGQQLFYRTGSMDADGVDDGVLRTPGGFVKDGNGVYSAFGALTPYFAPFEVPEPASGASALGCGCLLARRRRS